MVHQDELNDAAPKSKALESILGLPAHQHMKDVKEFIETDFLKVVPKRKCMRNLHDRCCSALEEGTAIGEGQEALLKLVYSSGLHADIANCIGYWTNVLQVDATLP